MKVFNLIFLGPQGSGKGTQARLLADKLNLVVLDTGGMMREIAKSGTEIGRKVHEVIHERGDLLEPELVAEIVKYKLLKISPEQGVVIDGFPRTLKQYELMRQFWPQTKRRSDYQILFLDISDEEAVRRLSSRVVCELCGSVYVAGQYENCQKCGGNLVQRADDRPEAIRRRLELFKAETKPLLKQFEEEGRLLYVDGSPAIEEIHREIVKKLGIS